MLPVQVRRLRDIGGWFSAGRGIVSLVVSLGLGGCAHHAATGEPSVHALKMEGNTTFDDGTLREQLATEVTGWWPFAAAKRLDVAALDLDLRRVTAFYADRGFFDARVVRRQVTPRADGAVDIAITLDEGKPTHVAQILWQSTDTPFDEKRWRAVAAENEVVVGRNADYAHYEATKNQIEGLLKEDGYAWAKVTGDMAVDRDRHEAIITYRLSSGPLVHLQQAILKGGEQFPTRKILHRVSWTPGDKYVPDQLATTQGRLYDLGVFSSVQITLPPQPTPEPDVTIALSPGKLHQVKLGAGVGVDRDREEVRLRAEWSVSNFLGGLRKLRLRIKPAYAVIPSVTDIQRSGPVLNADINLLQPDLANTNTTAQVTAAYDLTLTEGYAARGPRASLGLERPFLRDRLTVGASYNLQFVDFYDINSSVFTPTSTALGFGFKDPYRLAYLEEFVQVDLRNRSVARRPGGYLSLRLEEGSSLLGGEFRYVAVVPELKLFVPVARRVVVAGRALAGWLRPFGGGAATDSPITRRFRLGGPSSHRGFGFGRLSPQIADQSGNAVPVGGDAELLLSLEVRTEIARVAGSWVSLVPFLDAGDVTTSFDGISLGNLHRAAGLALEYASPIGVVRVGAAARLNRLSGVAVAGEQLENPDPGQRIAFHVTIGEAF